MDSAAIEQLIAQRVAEAIAAHEATKANETTTNGGDGGTGAVNGEGGGAEAVNGGAGGTGAAPETAIKPCTYKEFLSCKPLNFKGTEGAVGLARWFEKMESVFRISNCTKNCKVKYATCTLQDGALTWWNLYAQSVGIDTAYGLPWEDLKRMMRDEYCPRNEIQVLEAELWNLTVKGTDITSYTSRFNELALLCPTMVDPEYKRIERYIWGLPEQIQGSVTASKPDTIQSAVRMAHDLMAQVVRRGVTVEKDVGKRKREENPGGNPNQQPSKKQETVEAHAVGPNNRKPYAGSRPYCNKCTLHHTGPCGNRCDRCRKTGHQAKDCRSSAPAANNGAPMTCFECGGTGHIRRNCPNLKNQNNNNNSNNNAQHS